MAHPRELSKQSEHQAFRRYKEPCSMPCVGSTTNDYESHPSGTARGHAGRLLQNQKKAPLLYITCSRIATLIRKAVKKVWPSTLSNNLKKNSAHSLCVWVCVLLDEAGMSPSFIHKCLHWLGDSFKMYLRDTKAIQDKHFADLQTT